MTAVLSVRGPSANVIVPSHTTSPLTRAAPLSTPIRLRNRLTTASISTESPGWTGRRIPHALDAGKERDPAVVLGLDQDQDGPHLRDGFGQNRRWQHGPLAGALPQEALAQRHVLDPDNAPVRLERDDAVHEKKRIAMGKNAPDSRVVEGQL